MSYSTLPLADPPAFCDPPFVDDSDDDDHTTATANSNSSIDTIWTSKSFRPNPHRQLDNEDNSNDDDQMRSRCNTNSCCDLNGDNDSAVATPTGTTVSESEDDSSHVGDSEHHIYNCNGVKFRRCANESVVEKKNVPCALNGSLSDIVTANTDDTAVVKLSWADVEIEEDEIAQSTTSEGFAFPSMSLHKFPAEDINGTAVFDCFWTAWYDPPKGRTGRMGIATDAYEKKLFEMGVIQCLDDFWTVHEMVDWENMPFGSMVSFSRLGAKPFWEDPMHCQGGRWIIRGFPRSKSETCVTLQVKEKRRCNSIQLWTRTSNCFHIEEIQEHIFQLAEGWNSDNEKSPRQAKSRGRKQGRKQQNSTPSALSRLHFEFCSNMDSIHRNAVKLGDAVVPHTDAPIQRHKQKAFQLAVASRCNEVAKMCRVGRNRKKNGKGNNGSRKYGGYNNNEKIDWSDTLVSMGYGKQRSSKCDGLGNADQTTPSTNYCDVNTVLPLSASSEIEELTPEKIFRDASVVKLGTIAAASHGCGKQQEPMYTELPIDDRNLEQRNKTAVNNWRGSKLPREGRKPVRGKNGLPLNNAQKDDCGMRSGNFRNWRNGRGRPSLSHMGRVLTDDFDQYENEMPTEGGKIVDFNSWNRQPNNFEKVDSAVNNGSPLHFSCSPSIHENEDLRNRNPDFDQPISSNRAHPKNSTACYGVFDARGCWYPASATPKSDHYANDNSNSNERFCQLASSSTFCAVDTIDRQGSSSLAVLASRNSTLSGSQTALITSSQDTCNALGNYSSFDANPEKSCYGWETNLVMNNENDNHDNRQYTATAPYCFNPLEWQEVHSPQYWTIGSPVDLNNNSSSPPFYNEYPSYSYLSQDYLSHYNYYYNPLDSSYSVLGNDPPEHELYYSHSTEISRLADTVADEATKTAS